MNVVFSQRQIFLVAFVFGFISFLFFEYWTKSTVIHFHNKLDPYQKWRSQQHIQISNLDLDSYSYSRHLHNETLLESEWLRKRIHVTCIVFVEKSKLAAAIIETWGKRCNKLLLFSHKLNDGNLSVINLGIKYRSSWQYLCEVMNYIWKDKSHVPLQWIILVKDDTFVIPENLRYMLSNLDPYQPHYLGHTIIFWGQLYNVAQAGYVLSYESLARLMKKYDSPDKCIYGGKYWKKEDYYLGKNLASLGVYPTDTRDLFGHGTFNGFSLVALMWGIYKSGSYWTKSIYLPRQTCCSNKIVTFSIGEPSKMFTINYLLYELYLFQNNKFGANFAPTFMPEEEVWKSVLLEEFNITEVDEITNEEYFKIWKSKFSDPSHFMAKTYHNMHNILDSILINYSNYRLITNSSLN